MTKLIDQSKIILSDSEVVYRNPTIKYHLIQKNSQRIARKGTAINPGVDGPLSPEIESRGTRAEKQSFAQVIKPAQVGRNNAREAFQDENNDYNHNYQGVV